MRPAIYDVFARTAEGEVLVQGAMTLAEAVELATLVAGDQPGRATCVRHENGTLVGTADEAGWRWEGG